MIKVKQLKRLFLLLVLLVSVVSQAQLVRGSVGGGGGGGFSRYGINTQTVSYTPVLTDTSKIVRMNVATANTFTIPPNASVAFPIGTSLNVVQYGTGQVTFTAGSGVTILSAGSYLKTRVQYSVATLLQVATDVWLLTGDLTP